MKSKEGCMKGWIRALKKRGIPVTVVVDKLTPEEQRRAEQIERDVRGDYVVLVEEGHKKVAHSTLRFGVAG